MWEPQREVLEAAGYHVVAPDLPGAQADNTMGAWADRVLQVAAEPLVPVGLSMGGYLAFELWRRARDRITALVLADTRAGGETEESRRGRDETIRVVCEEGAPALWERLADRLFAPGAPGEVVSRARELALEQGAVRLRAALEAIRDRDDSRETLADIDVPVLVVVGEEDALTPPSESEAIVQGLRNGRLVRIDGAGHLSSLEQPDRFNAALVSFLDEVAR